MAFRVAEMLGMTREELGVRMSSYELSQWFVYIDIKNRKTQEAVKKETTEDDEDTES